MQPDSREGHWAALMQASLRGDAIAYRELLESLAKFLRMVSKRLCNKYGVGQSESEDIVQEVLLVVHLKRHTWDQSRPIGPWITAITRNKLIDALRQRGRYVKLSIDDVLDVLQVEVTDPVVETYNIERMLGSLREMPQKIVKSIAMEGLSIQETARRFGMTEVAVRVAFHRALKLLAARYNEENT
ncbi:sigma-70 family RNA polymerase sigma factor [Bradyrhizobium sp. SYSU BS000235]|uniref:sigma-70 family RNA polymerase sigma factor n=1 Tax=Bradyrhizobium sp. SYSU BS000235 TaxID=3411332 RepID=UPI003C745007